MQPFDFSVIRTLRKKWGMTADQLAGKANVTRSTIAKIEAGEANPTMTTIESLARVFQLAPSELVHLTEKGRIDPAQSKSFKADGYKGRRIWFPDFEVFCIDAPAGTHKEFDPKWHENTAEICLVMTGCIDLTVREETIRLEAGQAARFKALHSHFFDVIKDAVFLLIHHRSV